MNDRLSVHLEQWLGAWPPPGPGVTVIGSPSRDSAGWDGVVHDVLGVSNGAGAILSVSPQHAASVAALTSGRDLREDLDAIAVGLAALIGRDGGFGRGAFKWTTAPADWPDTGEWVPTDDPRVPEWLHPFNGDVLIAWADDGTYGGGVGRKQHDRFGHEISVGTTEALRGRGIARKLVATAARRILEDGAIPTYLHDHSNLASAHVATAAGFADLGWEVLGFF
jgi:GNAT superfamily N-acetyltransferase